MTISKLSVVSEEVLVQLVPKAKTMEELRQKTSHSYRELMNAVKKLLLDGAIEKNKGFPTEYKISKAYWMVAKKLRAKVDMSDLLDDPCDIFNSHYREKKSKSRQESH